MVCCALFCCAGFPITEDGFGNELSGLIKCYWTLESDNAAVSDTQAKLQTALQHGKQRILPDGCMEMIFHYGDAYRQYLSDGTSIIQPYAFVFGQITEPLDIEPTTNNIGMIAARFRPDGFLPFATLPLENMQNRAVPLEELFGEQGKYLASCVLSASGTVERLAHIETFLLAYLQSQLHDDTIVNRLSTDFATILFQHSGQISVGEISEQMRIHRRTLERQFVSTVGLSPKQFAKILRLQYAVKMLHEQKLSNLTALAVDAGYYDQAHFIKDFREFVGASPKQFYSDNLNMNLFFLKDESSNQE